MAGYSGTPLVKKLGIKPGFSVRLVNSPRGYERTLGKLPNDVKLLSRLTHDVSFIHVFAGKCSDLDRNLLKAKNALSKSGMLWVSWPKKSSGVVTDIDEGYVRRSGPAWSGLKFVYRTKDR